MNNDNTSSTTTTTNAITSDDIPKKSRKQSFPSSTSSSSPSSMNQSSKPPQWLLTRLILKQLISPHATVLFRLKDEKLRKQYRDFNIEQESSLYPIVISLAMFGVLPLFVGVAIQSQHSLLDLISSIILCISIIVIGILGVLVAYYHYCIDWVKENEKYLSSSQSSTSSTSPSTPLSTSPTVQPEADMEGAESTIMSSNRHSTTILIKQYQSSLHIISYLYIFFFELMFLCFAIRRGHSHICIDEHHQHVSGSENLIGPGFQNAMNFFFCGSNISITEDTHALPVDAMYLLALAPIVIATIFPSLDVILLWIQVAFSLFAYIAFSASRHDELNRHVPSICILFSWFSTNVFIIAQMQLDKINRFYLHLQLVELLEANQRNAEAFHVNEMRFLIANVAHDLKTPLMSFTSAITLISQYTEEYEVSYQDANSQGYVDNKQEVAHASTFLSNLKTCVSNLSDTNAFMLMTVNRCIDYAKATKGIKLTPKLETIHLWDALQLPLNCMKNVQDRVEIELLKPDGGEATLCPYIITDKQWLQENLLCLLSNAVKYSSRGKVTVSVSLTEARYDAFQVIDSTKQTSESTVEDMACTSTTKCLEQQPWLLFEVEDNGIGISPHAMSQLFKPFKQTQRLAGGTGLGLYSLAKRMEGIQGEFGVRGRKDGEKGSLFWFMIPYRPDDSFAVLDRLGSGGSSSEAQFPGIISRESTAIDSEDAGATLPPPPPPLPASSALMEDTLSSLSSSSVDHTMNNSSPTVTAIRKYLKSPLSMAQMVSSDLSPIPPASNSPKKQGLDILLVDDAQTIVKMTSMMLRKLGGHRITTAENGEVAVHTVENYWKNEGKCFDVILMDLQMPVMDGLEATKRIRALESGARDDCLPRRQLIVGVSANSDFETEQQALACGVDVFIGKPFTAAAFTKVLSNFHSI